MKLELYAPEQSFKVGDRVECVCNWIRSKERVIGTISQISADMHVVTLDTPYVIHFYEVKPFPKLYELASELIHLKE